MQAQGRSAASSASKEGGGTARAAGRVAGGTVPCARTALFRMPRGPASFAELAQEAGKWSSPSAVQFLGLLRRRPRLPCWGGLSVPRTTIPTRRRARGRGHGAWSRGAWSRGVVTRGRGLGGGKISDAKRVLVLTFSASLPGFPELGSFLILGVMSEPLTPRVTQHLGASPQTGARRAACAKALCGKPRVGTVLHGSR